MFQKEEGGQGQDKDTHIVDYCVGLTELAEDIRGELRRSDAFDRSGHEPSPREHDAVHPMAHTRYLVSGCVYALDACMCVCVCVCVRACVCACARTRRERTSFAKSRSARHGGSGASHVTTAA